MGLGDTLSLAGWLDGVDYGIGGFTSDRTRTRTALLVPLFGIPVRHLQWRDRNGADQMQLFIMALLEKEKETPGMCACGHRVRGCGAEASAKGARRAAEGHVRGMTLEGVGVHGCTADYVMTWHASSVCPHMICIDRREAKPVHMTVYVCLCACASVHTGSSWRVRVQAPPTEAAPHLPAINGAQMPGAKGAKRVSRSACLQVRASVARTAGAHQATTKLAVHMMSISILPYLPQNHVTLPFRLCFPTTHTHTCNLVVSLVQTHARAQVELDESEVLDEDGKPVLDEFGQLAIRLRVTLWRRDLLAGVVEMDEQMVIKKANIMAGLIVGLPSSILGKKPLQK